jgi:hypothetical protein
MGTKVLLEVHPSKNCSNVKRYYLYAASVGQPVTKSDHEVGRHHSVTAYLTSKTAFIGYIRSILANESVNWSYAQIR